MPGRAQKAHRRGSAHEGPSPRRLIIGAAVLTLLVAVLWGFAPQQQQPAPSRTDSATRHERRCPPLLLQAVRNAFRERDASVAGVGPPADVTAMLSVMLPVDPRCRAKALGGSARLAAQSLEHSGISKDTLELLEGRGLAPTRWDADEPSDVLSVKGANQVLEGVAQGGLTCADDAHERDDDAAHERCLLPRVLALSLLGRPAEATAALEEAIAVHTDVGDTPGQQLAAPPPHEAALRALYADALLDLGRAGEARPMLLRALAWHPGSAVLAAAAARVSAALPVQRDPLPDAAAGRLSPTQLRQLATEWD
eukprot:TRINITY_DN36339_c0_g1_i1.p1 TRINITY_DN36339_c0_g1~~TRINITY_DN36339_c0_g1_i1.p1  ORF type:complete len:310 (+),score=31.15 TRINITY_DN36339_c0_g1_i1:111-1040(+)